MRDVAPLFVPTMIDRVPFYSPWRRSHTASMTMAIAMSSSTNSVRPLAPCSAPPVSGNSAGLPSPTPVGDGAGEVVTVGFGSTVFVAVGGTGVSVAVGGTGVSVGGAGVSVAVFVAVGGIGVSVGGTDVSVAVLVAVGGIGVSVAAGVSVAVDVGSPTVMITVFELATTAPRSFML